MAKKFFLVFFLTFGAAFAFSQVFRVKLLHGGAFSWESAMSAEIQKYDVAQVAAIFEDKHDIISIKSKMTGENGKILQIEIEILGVDQVAALYDAPSQQILFDEPQRRLNALDEHLTAMSRRLKGEKKKQFLATCRKYVLRYQNAQGTLELTASQVPIDGKKIKIDETASFSIYGIKTQLLAQDDDGKSKIVLGALYNKILKKHFPSYFAGYFFDDRRALKGIPPYNKRFNAF